MQIESVSVAGIGGLFSGDSGLVAGVQAGREVPLQVWPESLVATASWMTSLAATWDKRLALLKRLAEQS
jgi:hypothetical protein